MGLSLDTVLNTLPFLHKLLRRGRMDLADKEAARLESAPNIEETSNTDPTLHAGGIPDCSTAPYESSASTSDSGHTSEALYHMAGTRDSTLAHIMRMVVDEIDAMGTTHSNFVIDFIPNHRELAKCKLFQNSANILARFDRSELAIKFAILLEHGPPESKPIVSPEVKRDSKNFGAGSASSLKHKKKAGDEHDRTKTSRRSQTLMCMSEPYIHTFEAAQRLLKVKCPEFAATNMLRRFKLGMKELGFKRRHGAWRVYLALAGIKKEKGQKLPTAISPAALVGTARALCGDSEEISLMDVLDALPRTFSNDDEDRAVLVDFENVAYSTAECLRVDKDVLHHPTMDDPHLAESAFCAPIPDVYSFAIGNELELYLPKCTDPDLCAAIVSRLAFKFNIC